MSYFNALINQSISCNPFTNFGGLLSAKAFQDKQRMDALHIHETLVGRGSLQEIPTMGQSNNMSHLGMVKDFRKTFRHFSKEEFRSVSHKPVVKEILIGMTKLNKDQIKERIKEHLDGYQK